MQIIVPRFRLIQIPKFNEVWVLMKTFFCERAYIKKAHGMILITKL